MNFKIENEIIKRFRQLKSDQADIDYRWSVWSADARLQFPMGTGGDAGFIRWMKLKLESTEHEAKDYLLAARAAAILPDRKTYIGITGSARDGHKQIAKLHVLSKKEQIEVLQRAKVENRQISSALKAHQEMRKKIGAVLPVPVKKHTNYFDDAFQLARWAAHTGGKLPPEIQSIVERYLPNKKAGATLAAPQASV